MKTLLAEMAEVNASMKLFNFLQDPHNERYTKIDAYCYLLNKACVQYIPENFSKEGLSPLADCQFITTKTELSEVWHWHRATVRSFLDKLSDCGQLKMQSITKGIICTMQELRMEFTAKPLQVFQAMSRYTMLSWASSKTTRNQTAIVCEQIIKNALALQGDFTIQQITDKQQKILTNQISALLIKDAVFASLHNLFVVTIPNDLVDSLVTLLVGHIDNNWQQMLLIIDELPQITIDGKTASHFINTEEAEKLFLKICLSYKSLLDCKTERASVIPTTHIEAASSK